MKHISAAGIDKRKIAAALPQLPGPTDALNDRAESFPAAHERQRRKQARDGKL